LPATGGQCQAQGGFDVERGQTAASALLGEARRLGPGFEAVTWLCAINYRAIKTRMIVPYHRARNLGG
jgi:hypothetical protein